MSAHRHTRYRDFALRTLCIIGIALITSACHEPPGDQDPDDVTCTAEAVLAQNPATGECEWISTCENQDWERCAEGFECQNLPADACTIDSRCEVQVETVCYDCAPMIDPNDPDTGDVPCGCFDTTTCVDVTDPPPPTTCADLGEAACIKADDCRAEYGWLDGTDDGQSSGGAAPCYDEDGDGVCDDFVEPDPEPTPEWGFIACVAGGTTPPPPPVGCTQYGDEGSCTADTACAWYPLYETCECGPDYCGCSGESTAGYCDERRPSSCYDHYDPATCTDTAGCEWVDISSGSEDCACPPEDPDCTSCGGLVAPAGYCQPTPEGCFDIASPDVCYDSGCEWTWEGEGAPAPCECTDPDCTTCVEPDPIGFCHPPTMPQTCEEVVDAGTCVSMEECEWLEAACACPPDAPDCDCFAPTGYCQTRTEPTCYDYYDPTQCTANPACQWTDGGSGDRVDPCYQAYLDDMGQCIGFDGTTAPDYCCDPDSGLVAPIGYCEPKPDPIDCWDIYDANICQTHPECQWTEDGGAGFVDPCYEAYLDENGVCTSPFGGEAPAECCAEQDPDPCWGAWLDETDTCRGPNDGVLPDTCCTQTEPAPPEPTGYCEPSMTTEPACTEHYDEFSCLSAGCDWLMVPCDCMPDDPMCECPYACTAP